jgi:hypothetical protein
MLNGIDYFPTTVNLSANMIETVDEDSGFENWKLTCSEAQGRIKFLLMDDNRYCCNAHLVWIRYFKECFTSDPPCYYNSNCKDRDCTLLNFKLENETQLQCQVKKQSSGGTRTKVALIAGPVGGFIAIIFTVTGIVYCYKKRKRKEKIKTEASKKEVEREEYTALKEERERERDFKDMEVSESDVTELGE